MMHVAGCCCLILQDAQHEYRTPATGLLLRLVACYCASTTALAQCFYDCWLHCRALQEHPKHEQTRLHACAGARLGKAFKQEAEGVSVRCRGLQAHSKHWQRALRMKLQRTGFMACRGRKAPCGFHHSAESLANFLSSA